MSRLLALACDFVQEIETHPSHLTSIVFIETDVGVVSADNVVELSELVLSQRGELFDVIVAHDAVLGPHDEAKGHLEFLD